MGTLAINRRRFLEGSSHLAVGAAAIAAAGGAGVIAPDLAWAATRIISPAQAASLTVMARHLFPQVRVVDLEPIPKPSDFIERRAEVAFRVFAVGDVAGRAAQAQRRAVRSKQGALADVEPARLAGLVYNPNFDRGRFRGLPGTLPMRGPLRAVLREDQFVEQGGTIREGLRAVTGHQLG